MSQQNSSTFFVLSRDDSSNYSKFKAILESSGWTNIEWLQDIGSFREKLQNLDQIKQADGIIACLAFIKPPLIPNKSDENSILQLIGRHFSSNNKSLLLIASGNGDDNDHDQNNNSFLNKLLAKLRFNVRFRRDNLIGMSPLSMDTDKLYHPKEVKLSTRDDEFIVNRALSQFISEQRQDGKHSFISMLYPFGCSLALKMMDKDLRNRLNGVVVMMTSGQAKNCLPKGQPICTFYEANLKSPDSFKMITFGSSMMITNDYIELQDNFHIISAFARFLSRQREQAFVINMSDANTLEIEPNFQYTPHIDTILNYPLLPMPVRSRKTSVDLFDAKLFNLDNSMLAKLSQAYEDLGLHRGPLSLIKPHFERQNLPLEPAVHKFLLRRPT